jgi:hypothetical protein
MVRQPASSYALETTFHQEDHAALDQSSALLYTDILEHTPATILPVPLGGTGSASFGRKEGSVTLVAQSMPN